MIPDWTETGGLPEGIHQVTWDEFKERFAFFDGSDRRYRIIDQLERLFSDAKRSGIVKRFIVAGSLVTSKAEPNDFDCLVVLDSEILGKQLRPIEYNVVSRKTARRLYGGDVVPVLKGSGAFEEYLEFFQTDREGRRVGVVEVLL
ncbi:MAG: hypothetical protein WD049_00485 [Candidatus Paceibacterota bacterium]